MPRPAAPEPQHTAREIGPLLAFAGHPELAERFSLGSFALDDPNTLVPLRLLHELIEAAVEVSGDAYLLLHFGAATAKLMRGRGTPLFHLMRHSPDLRTSFGRLLGHQRLWNPGEGYVLEEAGKTAGLRYLPWGPPREGQRQMAEKTVVQFLDMLRVFAAVEPTRVRFAYPESGRADELTRVLRVAPSFDAAATEVEFPAAALDGAVRSAEPVLFRALDRHMTKLAGRSEAVESLASRVRTQIASDLEGGPPSLTVLARRVGTSPRTLQRTLAREGTSLRALVEEVRRHRVEGLLAGDHTVAEMSYRLGYSDPSAFQHAFRRWFGTSPGLSRNRQRPGQGGVAGEEGA
jgi:AraC-like DNA-binding protein